MYVFSFVWHFMLACVWRWHLECTVHHFHNLHTSQYVLQLSHPLTSEISPTRNRKSEWKFEVFFHHFLSQAPSQIASFLRLWMCLWLRMMFWEMASHHARFVSVSILLAKSLQVLFMWRTFHSLLSLTPLHIDFLSSNVHLACFSVSDNMKNIATQKHVSFGDSRMAKSCDHCMPDNLRNWHKDFQISLPFFTTQE